MNDHNYSNSGIIIKVKCSVLEFIEKESWLIENNLSEKCITHQLAIYIANHFPDYNVDCEYNRKATERKTIRILKQRFKDNNLLKNKALSELEKEILERAVFPDIIIHKRGEKSNLCVIEVKKSNSRIQHQEYDYLKLESYTDKENDFNYQLGIFLLLNDNSPSYKYFENGKMTDNNV